jgi:hypothetical protein
MRFVAVLIVLLLTGCARYGYEVVSPEQFQMTVPAQQADSFIERDLMSYALQTADSRLVLRAYNHSDAPVTLLGAESFLVDPQGQSHPLTSMTIAPQSFIRFILPPLQPQVQPRGPQIGFGVGVGTGVGSRVGVGTGVGAGTGRGHVITDPGGPYWEWRGTGDVRLTMVLEQDQRRMEHDFVFRRVRVR